MSYSDKITNACNTIKNIERTINEINNKYTEKIIELNRQLKELRSGATKKSAQYIKQKTSKIQKEYNDIVKGFNDKMGKIIDNANAFIKTKIEELKNPIAGELGSKLGLPVEAAGMIASPVVITLASMITITIPELSLPELDFGETEENT